MWTIASGDEQLGLVYLPMGNDAADYYSSLRRPPENAYATPLVALDVTTGKPRWHFQAVKKDVWAYDLGRSEERRVGKECVSMVISRWSPIHKKKTKTIKKKT